jgi:hypothetical protein
MLTLDLFLRGFFSGPGSFSCDGLDYFFEDARAP